MIGQLARKIFGSANDRYVKRQYKIVNQINAFEPSISALSDEELKNKKSAEKGEFKMKNEKPKHELIHGPMLVDERPNHELADKLKLFDEKGELIINVCANKKDLLKLKSILIEFKNENLFEKEITNDEPKRIVRR